MKLKELIVASQNKHKIDEIKEILKPLGFSVISRDESGIPDFEIEENGETFEENSLLKAKVICEHCNKPVIADDSGLSVDALDGAPGVYSARFAGVPSNDRKNNEKLVSLVCNLDYEERKCAFVSVVTIVFPDGRIFSGRGECSGHLLLDERGSGGFGYDPLFVPDGFDKTFAELSGEEKNSISHRKKALDDLKEKLRISMF